MINEGIALDDGLDFKESTYDNASIKQQDVSSSSEHVADAERVRVDVIFSDKDNVVVGPSLDNNTLTEVHHSKNDTFENVFVLEILNHEHLEVEKCTKTAQTFHMLLPKQDNGNMGKKALGFENQNDVENPFILNKAKGLTPSLYNIDEIRKDMLSDHKITSKEELKCEAEKSWKVKQ
ncbi:hypothetical protein Tco_1420457 [Tanacetum coccineum]